LVQTFATKFRVIAFDVSTERVKSLGSEFGRYPDVKCTTDVAMLNRATHFLISVPTLLNKDRSINLSHLKEAIDTVASQARAGATIIIESSVAVGTTRELLAPIMRKHGLKGGMSPERVDPGRKEPSTTAIPKVISGLDDIAPGSLASIMEIYSSVFRSVVAVSKPEVAEMVKLYENCQRMVCIAYANEMADACISWAIDPYEVCEAADTKPFGYMPMKPGAGVGGHCIPINP
jgi:nucleotide sugar dehydrogenase